MIRVDGLVRRFGDVGALDGASLTVEGGEVVAVLGPSGCGKTTLLRALAGFEQPDEGTIEIGGRLVAGPGVHVAPEHRLLGMVFQDYALFPHLTVARNVGFGLSRRGRQDRVAQVLGLVDLDGVADRYPHQLSGGQQQRVAHARALAPSPDVVLLDEPWSNVDPILREELRAEVTGILRPLGVTVLLVTHDRDEAFTLADRIALMRNGRIVQVGSPEQVYHRPQDRWTAEFVGPANVLGGRVAAGRVHTVLGSFPPLPPGEDTAVAALVRPERLELAADPEGDAEVVGREFRGHDVVYRVLLDGVQLVSQRPSNESLSVGARVRVRVLDSAETPSPDLT